MTKTENNISIELTHSSIENLNLFSELLGKDINTMLDEALTQYFENEQRKMIEKSIEDDSMMTNLDYDEFWDGVDV